MGRPKNTKQTVKVPISATPKLLQYLDDLKDEESHGNTRAEVAKKLVWDGIHELIYKGVIDRRKKKK